MINEEYAKAYKEIIEILKYVPYEDVAKIPNEKIEFYKQNMDQSYSFSIDENREFSEQKISDITKAILANIFRDYWATPEQREKIIAKEKFDLNKIEEEKKIKYNPDNLFKNNLSEKESHIESEETTNLPIESKKESFFIRLLKYIKNIFFKI